MKIAFITDSINEYSTGIGYYANYVMNNILILFKDYNFLFIDFEKKSFTKDNLILVKNPFKILKTHLWHNILPYKLRNMEIDLILNFTSSPHLLSYKQKEVFFV